MTSSMPDRPADVFFYGLFMEQELLRSKGLRPERVEVAWVDGLELRIGQRAALTPRAGARVYGLVMTLTLGELDQLYSEAGVQAYRPEPVLACLSGGGTIAAMCYNLPEPPAASEHNPEYAEKLRAVARKVGLPAEYLSSIR